MKKAIVIFSALLVSITATAQTNFQSMYDREFNFDVLHITGTLIGIYLVTSFLLTLVRLFLESRVKHKMIDKGVSETVVEQFLHPTTKDSRSAAMKWFIVSSCVGLGLAAINLSLPLGIHSLAIMAFSISLGFLGYYFFMKKNNQ
ncbi:MAG TPA: hypothetical protein VKT28_22420 [Puia sp.]|nr:hypothetical protein [Puia sp.]